MNFFTYLNHMKGIIYYILTFFKLFAKVSDKSAKNEFFIKNFTTRGL